MVPRYALRKLSLFPPPVRTHAPHTERDERRAAARANGVDAGATPPPGIRRKRPRRSAPAAAPRTAPNGVEHFRDLHSIWSAEGSQGKKNDLDASAACGHGRAASRSLGPGDRPGLVAEPTRAERPHLRRASVRSSVARGWGQAAAAGRGAVLVSGWRSAVTWRRLGDGPR